MKEIKRLQTERGRKTVSLAATVTANEEELAKRAGELCPVCGGVIGANGMCFRGQECIDDGMRRVIPGWPHGRDVSSVSYVNTISHVS